MLGIELEKFKFYSKFHLTNIRRMIRVIFYMEFYNRFFLYCYVFLFFLQISYSYTCWSILWLESYMQELYNWQKRKNWKQCNNCKQRSKYQFSWLMCMQKNGFFIVMY